MRVDEYLFLHGQADSARQAGALVMLGLVYVNDTKAEKAGDKVPKDAVVTVRAKEHDYVSRGGLKLEKSLQAFPIDLKDKVCMDIGASTGGFTDCMLQNGASQVYAVDVAYGQLAWKLRQDERVVNLERSNIRKLTREDILKEVEFFSVDVSFISLKHIFPVMAELCADEACAVCLVKPQFEARREQVGDKGVVRSVEVHKQVITEAQEYAVRSGFECKGLTFSPITGPKGNIEFLLYVQRCKNPCMLDSNLAESVVAQAHEHLPKGDGKS